MAIPCPPAAVKQSVIMAEFGVTGNNAYLSRTLGPFIGKPSGTRVAFSDFCGASANSGPEANGGTISDSNGYRHHIFTPNSNPRDFCITAAGQGGADNTTIYFLSVGGGAGGGSGGRTGTDKHELGAGGGAGGYLTGTIPNTVACRVNYVGIGGAGASATTLARGTSGMPSYYLMMAVLYSKGEGGGGGGSMYNGQWDGGNGGSGGGGGGKYQGTSGTKGGYGTALQGKNGAAGGAYGAGGGGGARTNGNPQNTGSKLGGSGGGGLTYAPQNKPYAVGGGGAGYLGGGSGYNMAGNGGTSYLGIGTATAATREGCGGGGGGSGGASNGGENGKSGKQGIIIYSYKK